MDAECEETQGGAILGRESRWSMNSQRLEEIVAELMRPIGDLRRSFDTDLSALLEEYLTEAGLHALDAGEEDEPPAAGPAPNFAELALLLQQSASLYGRKVDFLYQHVLAVSDSLHKHVGEEGGGSGDTEESPGESGGRRKRRASAEGAGAAAAFAPIELEAGRGALREAEAPRPPPTLPRLYLELEPRTLSQRDTPLTDHAGEPIGLLADFHVAWRLQGGFLVEDLEDADDGRPVDLPSISLSELQALQAAGCVAAQLPPSPPPPCEACASSATPPAAAEEPCPATPPPAPLRPATPPPPRLERKRKLAEAETCSLNGLLKSVLKKRHKLHAQGWVEFGIPREWQHEVVRTRRALVLRLRRELRDLRRGLDHGFAGFGSAHPADVGGFRGWRAEEAVLAAGAGGETEAALAVTTPAEGGRADSDDDGFFEQSPLRDCEHSPSASSVTAAGRGGDEQWAREVAARAEADGAVGLDVRAVGERVLGALRAAAGGAAPVPYAAVLRQASAAPADVSHLFLATLFLANAGAVRVVRGAPLALADFALQLSAAAEAGPLADRDASPG